MKILKLIFFTILLIPIINTCYVGPEFNNWDFSTMEDVSKKIGIELYIIIPEGTLPNDLWERYSGTVPRLNENNFRVYESLWRNQPREWIIFRRTTGSNFFWLRLLDSEFNRSDFATIQEASNKIDFDLTELTEENWTECEFIINLADGFYYRVYECKWRERSGGIKRFDEWFIFKRDGEKYFWYKY